MFNFRKPKEIKKTDLMITHGGITHPFGARCKTCDKVKKEFEKEYPCQFLSPCSKEANKTLKNCKICEEFRKAK